MTVICVKYMFYQCTLIIVNVTRHVKVVTSFKMTCNYQGSLLLRRSIRLRFTQSTSHRLLLRSFYHLTF